MAKKLEGIQIQIGADTTGLAAAISGAEKQAAAFQTELNAVNRALKFDPSNVDMLAQKAAVTGGELSALSEKAQKMRAAMADAEKQMAEGKLGQDAFRELQRELAFTENKMQSLRASMVEGSANIAEAVNEVGGAALKLSDITAGAAMGGLVKDGIESAAGAMADFAKQSITTGANFEAAMSNVAATLGKTKGEVGGLSEVAREMGAATKFSAVEAADALNFLAQAGYDARAASEALPVVLDMAAAGNLQLAQAADLTANAMSSMGLGLSEMNAFTDQLAATAQKSNTPLAALGEALLTVGGTAKTLSGGVAEANALLGVLANAGIKGAEGGTHLRNVIMSLSAPTDKAAEALKKLGVDAADADGNLRPVNETMKRLEEALGGMGGTQRLDVLSDIFNKTDLAAVQTLTAKCGAEFDALAFAIGHSDGAAANMAKTMNDNLNGRIEELSSAAEEAQISIFNGMKPAMEAAIAVGQALLDGFNGLPEGLKTVVTWAGTAAGAFAALKMSMDVAGTAGLAVKALTGVGTAGGAASGGLAAAASAALAFQAAIGPVGWAIEGAAAAAIVAGAWIAKSFHDAKEAAEAQRQTLIHVGEALTDLDGKLSAGAKAEGAAAALTEKWRSAKSALEGLTEGTDEHRAAKERLSAIENELAGLSDGSIHQIELENGLTAEAVEALNEKLRVERELLAVERERLLAENSESALAAEAQRLQAQRDAELERMRRLIDVQRELMLYQQKFNAVQADGTLTAKQRNEALRQMAQEMGAFGEAHGVAGLQLANTAKGIDEALAHNKKVMDETSDGLKTVTGEWQAAVESLSKFKALLTGAAEQAEDAAEATDDLAGETAAFAGGAAEAAAEVSELAKGVSDCAKESETLEKHFELLSHGGALNAAALSELIEKYPEVAKYIQRTGDLSLENGGLLKRLAEDTKESIRQELAAKRDQLAQEADIMRERLRVMRTQYLFMSPEAERQAQTAISDINAAIAKIDANILALDATGKEAAKDGAKSAKDAAKTAEDAVAKQYADEKAQIENAKKYRAASIQEQITSWEALTERYAEGTKQREEIENNLYKLRADLAAEAAKDEEKAVKERFKADKQAVEDTAKLKASTAADEAAAWGRLQALYKEGGEERQEIDRKLAESRVKAVNEMLAIEEEALKKIEKLDADYDKALEDRAAKLANYAGLFSTVELKTDVSAGDLKTALKSQVDTLTAWTKDMASLEARGVSEGLMNELAQMGPSAAAEIHALTTMSDKQLEEYAGLYAQKQKIANDRAKTELEKLKTQTSRQINDIVTDAKNQLADYALKTPGLGANAVDGLIAGIDSRKGALSAAVAELTRIIDGTLRAGLEIHSPSRVLFRDGAFSMDGLLGGIRSKMPDLRQAMAAVTDSVAAVRPRFAAAAPESDAAAGRGPKRGRAVGDVTVNQYIGGDGRDYAREQAEAYRLGRQFARTLG